MIRIDPLWTSMNYRSYELHSRFLDLKFEIHAPLENFHVASLFGKCIVSFQMPIVGSGPPNGPNLADTLPSISPDAHPGSRHPRPAPKISRPRTRASQLGVPSTCPPPQPPGRDNNSPIRLPDQGLAYKYKLETIHIGPCIKIYIKINNFPAQLCLV